MKLTPGGGCAFVVGVASGAELEANPFRVPLYLKIGASSTLEARWRNL